MLFCQDKNGKNFGFKGNVILLFKMGHNACQRLSAQGVAAFCAAQQRKDERAMKQGHQLLPDHLEPAPRPGEREILYPAAAGHRQRPRGQVAEKEGTP
jgi:hypothetical protein